MLSIDLYTMLLLVYIPQCPLVGQSPVLSKYHSNMPTDQIDTKDLPILHRVGAKEHRSKEMQKLLKCGRM